MVGEETANSLLHESASLYTSCLGWQHIKITA